MKLFYSNADVDRLSLDEARTVWNSTVNGMVDVESINHLYETLTGLVKADTARKALEYERTRFYRGPVLACIDGVWEIV
jgi:hypothetical protein